uniref:Nucleotid_trans domain-containing protein n=1 Tax=Globodera pallida TaxID=36090 RepID=A0A183BQP3_GLOPA
MAKMELLFNEKLHFVQQGQRTVPSNNKNKVALFLVVMKAEDLRTEYRLAHRTLQCYCAMKHYPLIVVDLSRNATLQELCPQKDFMFRRHCALSHWLADHPSVEWTLFLDADTAIINPNHLVEDYIPSGDIDLVFYERIFNGEIAAGSYLARNTEFTRKFLQYWANYYDELPWSWHGTDNGAIHAVFMDYFCGKKDEIHCSKRWAICWQLWRASTNDDGLRMFTDCVRSVLGKRNKLHDKNGNVKFLTNFRTHWSRDAWLSGGKWCARDFFIHGWKKKWQNSSNWGGWKSPLRLADGQLDEALDLAKCSSESQPKWPYDASYIASTSEIDTLLEGHLHEMRMTQLDYWRRIEEAQEQQGQL